jgi:FkbM family methyltransferase
MIDFSIFPSDRTLAGRIMRFPLKLLPAELSLPILQGPMRGKKWIVDSGIKSFWLGCYERHFQRLLVEKIKPGKIFYDIGANVGFLTLLASDLVCNGKVIAFEPLPVNAAYLRRHLELNHIQNVEVYEAAVSDQSGRENFSGSDHIDFRGCGKLEQCGGRTVATVTLDSLIQTQGLPAPDFIKMDIEGAEARAIAGAEYCLKTYRPVMFLGTHGANVRRQCSEKLTSWGFEISAIKEMDNDTADLLVTATNPGP